MNDVKIQDGGFIFSSGRIVWISRLWMEHTYEGCMEGTPEANSQHIRQSMCEEMRKRFGQKVTVIEPGKEVLPRLTWIAKFESAKGAKNDDPDCNSALLVRAHPHCGHAALRRPALTTKVKDLSAETICVKRIAAGSASKVETSMPPVIAIWREN